MTSGTKPRPLSASDLRGPFDNGCKNEADLAVGVEWEKIGVLRENGEAIRYSGPRGVKTIFTALTGQFGWTPVPGGDGQPIALKKADCSITLEPGGQIELSGQKSARLSGNASELYQHLHEIQEVSRPLAIVWLGLGAQPFSRAQDIEWVPKDRYRIMRDNLKGQGALTFSMMKETASVQISIDYLNEKDAADKFRLALALSPVLTALFANSPLEAGRESDYLSRRAHIWQHTDPRRTGMVWKAFEPSFGFKDYVDYALDIPLLFLQRNERWLKPGERTFREFLEYGWEGHEATLEDWKLHLTSIFTEARLKNYLEIRSVDCQNVATGLAAVAFIKGLFYHPPSREGAWRLLAPLSVPERQTLAARAPRQALETPFRSGTLLDLSRELALLAQAGLTQEERKYLEPLWEILKDGRCPGQRLLGCLRDVSGKKERLEAILRCSAIQ